VRAKLFCSVLWQHSVHYNEATRTLQFQTTKSGFFALAQRRTADLPYRWWSMAPALEEKAADGPSPVDVNQDEEGCVHFTLSTPRVEEIKIQIRGSTCQLLEPKVRFSARGPLKLVCFNRPLRVCLLVR
jgi:hypothetical protein